MEDLFLNPTQVKALIKKAGDEDEVVVCRCVRKGPASKPGGPDQGDLYDLHCTAKPKDYVPSPSSRRDRKEEDNRNGVLTVFVTNRKDPKTDAWGAWRRLNIEQVKMIIYRDTTYKVVAET